MKRTGRTGQTGSGGSRMRMTAGVVGFACILAACSSSNAGPEPEPEVTTSPTSATTEVPETTTTSTTTAPTTTTTNPPPVVDTVATGSSEPAPDTTVASLPAPTNTTFDPTTIEGEVERAVLSNLIVFYECAEQLPNCDVAAATQFAALDYAEGNVAIIEQANSAGYEIRNGQDYTAAVESVEIFSDGNEAFATTCVWDGTQLVSPATDTTPEQIIDGSNLSRRDRYALRRIGDAWLVTARDSIESVDGRENNLCA